MKLIESVNILENKKLIMWLNIISIPVMILFFLLFTVMVLWDNTNTLLVRDLTFGGILVSIISLIGVIVIHELIHGLFFKIFYPQGKVKFGFKNGLAYASSPNSLYPRGKFLVILLSPFILITVALIIFYKMALIAGLSFVIIASIHASACIGDFYFAFLVIKAPKNTYVEDTEQGINLYLSM